MSQTETGGDTAHTGKSGSMHEHAEPELEARHADRGWLMRRDSEWRLRGGRAEERECGDFCRRQREQIKGKKDHAFPSWMATCPQGDLQKWGG